MKIKETAFSISHYLLEISQQKEELFFKLVHKHKKKNRYYTELYWTLESWAILRAIYETTHVLMLLKVI